MKVLTSERIRLCEITREEAVSISAVAQKLERDPKSVRRDAQSLERVGILRTRIATNPGHGNIRMVEAIAARLELRTPI